MDYTSLFEEIRSLIARNRLSAAFKLMSNVLNNSPLLDEAVLQSARWHEIRKHIRQGTLSQMEANLTLNQIRASILDLLREIEEQSVRKEISEELERTYSLISQKNSRRKWFQVVLIAIGSLIVATSKFFGSLFINDAKKTDSKIQVNGNNNTVIDMSNSDSNTVNQTIYESAKEEKSNFELKKSK